MRSLREVDTFSASSLDDHRSVLHSDRISLFDVVVPAEVLPWADPAAAEILTEDVDVLASCYTVGYLACSAACNLLPMDLQ